MLQRLAYSAIVIVAAVSTPALLAHLVALPSGASEVALSASEPRDDGWRRTKQGWCQLSPRVLPAVPASEAAPPSVPPPPVRWDLHPATLTIVLVLGVICAFFLFPHQAGLHSRHKSESLF